MSERRTLLDNEIRRYLAILVERPDVLGVVVFGSAASGLFHDDSDIDLMVVQKTKAPFMRRLRELRHLLHPRVATDLIVYTWEEICELSRKRPFVQQEILRNGKILYEREHGTLASLCT